MLFLFLVSGVQHPVVWSPAFGLLIDLYAIREKNNSFPYACALGKGPKVVKSLISVCGDLRQLQSISCDRVRDELPIRDDHLRLPYERGIRVCCDDGVGLVGMYVSFFYPILCPISWAWLINSCKKACKGTAFF